MGVQARHDRYMASLRPQSSPSAAEAVAAERAPDIQATFCATLVDEWVRAGVTHAVVSPGSRSTPMAMALAESRLRLAVVLDERSAAFRALGTARATGRPTVLLCTSGTAAVEYHAAVAEADLDHVPLIVCTADRPPELHGIGAPQTVDQQALYGRSVRWFGQIGVPDEANRSAWRSFAARAHSEALQSVRGPGPVHINLPFREPLIGTPGPLPPGRNGGAPWHTVVPGRNVAVASGRLEPLLSLVRGRRGIIVAGAGAVQPGDEAGAEVLHRLAAALGWPVLADPRSGLRSRASTTVSAADAILRNERAAAALRPEVVLRIGAPWASKVLGQWLASLDVAIDVLIDPYGAWLDPQRQAQMVICADPVDIARGLLDLRIEEGRPMWKALWRSVSAAADDALGAAFGDGADQATTDSDGSVLSEPWIARNLVRALPPGTRLVVSSSMPIRDVEWFSGPQTGVEILANRGANGIDGVVSTILGSASVGDGRPTVGLLGDLSFLHDAGAFASAAGLNAAFFVVDNGGGGIFEFLPQSSSMPRERFELLFGTNQPVSVADVARGYGLTVAEVSTRNEVLTAVRAVGEVGLRVIIMRTDRQANVAEHDRLNAVVSAAVEAVLPR